MSAGRDVTTGPGAHESGRTTDEGLPATAAGATPAGAAKAGSGSPSATATGTAAPATASTSSSVPVSVGPSAAPDALASAPTAASASARKVTAPNPALCAAPVATTPWAVAASRGSQQAVGLWLPAITAAGVPTVRGFATDAPSAVATQLGSGVALTGILLWSPPGQPATFPVADLDGWRAYVARTLAAYPTVRSWEVWNEAPNFSADANPAHYAAIVAEAYDVARSTDPSLAIGLSVKATDVRWMGEAIRSGAAGHFDFVALHPYERIGMLPDGNELSFLGTVSTVRAMLAATSPAQASVPVRFTEAGIPIGVSGRTFDRSTVSPEVQAQTLVKTYVMGLAQGAESIAWYDPTDGDYRADAPSEPPYGLVTRAGVTRPAYTALGTLIANLGQRPTYLGALTWRAGSYGFAFADDTDLVVIAWSRDGITLGLPPGSKVVDPTIGAARIASSVSLTAAPVLVRVPVGLAGPWVAAFCTGDVSGIGLPEARRWPRTVETASLSATGGPSGVSLAVPRPTALVDGRSAFVMSGTTSTPIVVDSSFTAWTRTSLTVTAVVHPLGGSPGFNLKYDADVPVASLDWAGQRGAGTWRSVPGTGWSTITWRIDDAALVGKYGFQLRLDSDSPAHSDYALESLTVTRN